MSTMNISAPERSRRERDRQTLRVLLLAGASSQPAGFADEAYFAGLAVRR